MAQPNMDPAFIPRKEFMPTQHIYSTFSLLTFSGSSLVRLYSFPQAFIASLRRYLNDRRLLVATRQDAAQTCYEYTIEGRPWTKPKSLETERLIVDLLRVVLGHGYIFLSTIDYGRENDDKVAIAFSKPQPLLDRDPMKFSSSSNLGRGPSPLPPSGSATTLAPQSPTVQKSLQTITTKTPFAVSFPSASLLRVISPPLNDTPAILNAVRGSWPRGVLSEKKVGEASYEFKLNGYKWFQEDTFATDSLRHILSLLSSLDTHAFTLLTSISLTNHSRVKDLWIFTGVGPEITGEESGDRESLAFLRSSSNQSHSHSNHNFDPPHVLGHRRLATVPDVETSDRDTINPISTIPTRARAATESSILPFRPLGPRPQSPLAQSVLPLRRSSPRAQWVQHPTKAGSAVDMTGVGAGGYTRPSHLRNLSIGQPAVIYATTGAGAGPVARSRSSSDDGNDGDDDDDDDEDTVRKAEGETPRLESDVQSFAFPNPYASVAPPSEPPSYATDIGEEERETFTFTNTALHSPPVAPAPEEHVPSPSPSPPFPGGMPTAAAASVPVHPTTPSPPLLSPAAFRDSAFTTGSRDSGWTGTDRSRSCEVDIKWVGRERDDRLGSSTMRNDIAEESEGDGPGGVSFPGAWASASAERLGVDNARGMVEHTRGTHSLDLPRPNPNIVDEERKEVDARVSVPDFDAGMARKSSRGVVGMVSSREVSMIQHGHARSASSPLNGNVNGFGFGKGRPSFAGSGLPPPPLWRPRHLTTPAPLAPLTSVVDPASVSSPGSSPEPPKTATKSTAQPTSPTPPGSPRKLKKELPKEEPDAEPMQAWVWINLEGGETSSSQGSSSAGRDSAGSPVKSKPSAPGPSGLPVKKGKSPLANANATNNGGGDASAKKASPGKGRGKFFSLVKNKGDTSVTSQSPAAGKSGDKEPKARLAKKSTEGIQKDRPPVKTAAAELKQPRSNYRPARPK